MVDSHCHLQFPQYDPDREEVIRHALNEGVQMICVGTDEGSSKKAIALAGEWEGMWATVGLHPNDQKQELRITNYEELLNHPKVVAVGEVGLDYYRTKEPGKQVRQKEVFKQFLELAGKRNKPLVVHSRAAFADTLSILNSYFLIRNSIAAVIHSFTYSWEQARQFLTLGLYIGLNGIVTFTDQYNETIRRMPLERILLETDAPYLAPVPYRGKRNEPRYLAEVAAVIAKVREISVEEVMQITTQNAEKFFKIPVFNQ